MEKNAENYIYDYCEDVKRQVDIRRKDLKFKIDMYSDEIIKSVELNQMNLIKLSKEANQLKTNIERIEFHKILAVYKDSLIGNKKYILEFKELPIEDIFGRVIEFQVNF